MKTVLAWIVGALLVAMVIWGALHVFISPVNPKQAAPDRHVQTSCWACHFVSNSAKVTTSVP
jgi:CBS domain containing-hemolysin-like protein